MKKEERKYKVSIELISLIIICIMLAFDLKAQYTKIFDFNGANGSQPFGNLYYDGNYFYGITFEGGVNNIGVIFKIKPDGAGFTKLLDFNGDNGAYSSSSFISDGTYLYAMTQNGGSRNMGTVFKIKPDGTGYSEILDFDSINGRGPDGPLYCDGTWLYGIAQGGGPNNKGLIFKIMPDGTGYTDLFNFNGTNGAGSFGTLITDGTYLYGMTVSGGANNFGTVFKIKPDGTGFTSLLDFNGTNGKFPFGYLTYDGIYLYGMTEMGGLHNSGLLFRIMPDGTGYKDLYDFSGTNGANPDNNVIIVGGYLYGMTWSGGSNSEGVIFKIRADGTGYSKMLDFKGANGAHPDGSFIYEGGCLYAMTNLGGVNDKGIIFKYQISACTAVSITKEPQDITVCNSGRASFSVTAAGDENIYYQWQALTMDNGKWTMENVQDGGSNPKYTGSNTNTITVTGDTGTVQFRCIVSNCTGINYATSNTATLNSGTEVRINPSFHTESKCLNKDSISFTITTTGGTAPFSYQWLLNGTIIAGATKSNYSKASLSNTDAGKYSCIVSNTCNSETGDIVSLAVLSNCDRTHHKISGYVTYHDNANTPMSSKTAFSYTKINLYNIKDSLIDSCQTDDKGYYEFVNVTNGTYYVSGTTNKTWRQCQPSDALRVNRNYIGLYTIPVTTSDSLYFKAADVFTDLGINPKDALMLNRRYIGVIKSFQLPASSHQTPDWIFEKIRVDMKSTDLPNQNVRVICAGDVAGRYTAPLLPAK